MDLWVLSLRNVFCFRKNPSIHLSEGVEDESLRVGCMAGWRLSDCRYEAQTHGEKKKLEYKGGEAFVEEICFQGM